MTVLTLGQLARAESALALQADDFAAAVAGIGGDQHGGVGIQDAVLQGIGAEAPEDDAVDGPDPGAGQQGDRQFGDHGHVDRDPVPFLHPFLLQDVGEFADFCVELLA